MSEARTLEHRGCRLAYGVSGSGAPVVWIQGVGLHGRGWAPQVDALSSRFRCLVFDNRGMAASQPVGDEKLSFELMVSDIVALMDHEGFEKAHLVGHSMGGVLALATALAHRDRVRSLTLMCTFARGADATKPSAPMMWIGMRTMIGTRRMRRLAFLELVMTREMLATRDKDALAAELEPIFGHDLGERPPIVMAQLAAMGAYDATPRLGELASIPTLVMSAKHDVIAPPERGRAMADAIPGARYEEFADAAHGLPISHATRVNELLASHLSRT
jgi:pimeloyl-ACP methyl ester carboxylesterase